MPATNHEEAKAKYLLNRFNEDELIEVLQDAANFKLTTQHFYEQNDKSIADEAIKAAMRFFCIGNRDKCLKGVMSKYPADVSPENFDQRIFEDCFTKFLTEQEDFKNICYYIFDHYAQIFTDWNNLPLTDQQRICERNNHTTTSSGK